MSTLPEPLGTALDGADLRPVDNRDGPRVYPVRAGTGSPRRLSAARDDGPLRHCEERSDEAIQRRHRCYGSHDRITNVRSILEAEYK